jgi:transcriptional regulator with XRE-family HTH domain
MAKSVPREQRVAMGTAIVFWRRQRGLKQNELATKCGWRSPYLSKYETGDSWPPDKVLRTVARVLDLPRETLYLGQEALLQHRERVLAGGEGSDFDYALPSESEQEVREPVAGLPHELTREWRELERREALLASHRRRLELETQAALIRAALADTTR